jgi:hypothetical protein
LIEERSGQNAALQFAGGQVAAKQLRQWLRAICQDRDFVDQVKSPLSP